MANDADQERGPLLAANLEPLHACDGVSLNMSHQPAERLLREAYLEHRFFDLIDLDPLAARMFCSSPRSRRCGLEVCCCLRAPTVDHPRGMTGLRPCVGLEQRLVPTHRVGSWRCVCNWLLSPVRLGCWERGLEPLFSFSDGRTFRVAVRMRQRIRSGEEQQLGFLARCERCGDQAVQAMLDLQGWRPCACTDGCGRWAVSGPLWIGPLQDVSQINGLLEISNSLDAALSMELREGQDLTLSPRSRRMLDGLIADPGQPACCWVNG